MRRPKTCLATLMSLLLAPSAWSHHSTQVSYQMDRTIELTGVVTEFRFQNPHSQLLFDVVDEDGNVVHWAAELASPGNWMRRGWNRHTFKPGDQVSFQMHPSRSGAPIGHPETIKMADGTVVDQGGRVLERPGVESPR